MTDIKKSREFIVDEVIDLIGGVKIPGVEVPGFPEIESAGTWSGVPVIVTHADGTQEHYTLGVELTARNDQEADDDDQ